VLIVEFSIPNLNAILLFLSKVKLTLIYFSVDRVRVYVVNKLPWFDVIEPFPLEGNVIIVSVKLGIIPLIGVMVLFLLSPFDTIRFSIVIVLLGVVAGVNLSG
jgi:hypothetical protein